MDTLIPNNNTTPTPRIVFFVAIIIIITTFFCIKNSYSYYLPKSRRRQHPPGPRAIHGPMMKISMAGTPVYVVSDPETAKQVLKNADFASKSMLGFGLAQYNIYHDFSFANAQHGPYWRIMDLATRMSFVQVFGPLKGLDLFGNGKRLTAKLWEYDEEMERIMAMYEEELTSARRCRRRDIGEEEQQRREGKDVMEILLETYRDPSAQLKMAREHIECFFFDILSANVDTMAAVIEFSMAELINKPRVLKKLREEIDSVVGSKRVVKESDVPKLLYLQSIIKETLRKHPTSPLLRRQCNVDTTINGYDIDAGTLVVVNAYSFMRDPETWKQPDEFLPERFFHSPDSDVDYKGRDCLFLPFGSGSRACPGSSHGLILAHATVASLAQCFDWKLASGTSEEIDIGMVNGYSGAMPFPLMCYPVSRLDELEDLCSIVTVK